MAKYDGNKITLIDNPINTKEYSNESSGPIIYQNGLYIIFKSNNNINKLEKVLQLVNYILKNSILESIYKSIDNYINMLDKQNNRINGIIIC